MKLNEKIYHCRRRAGLSQEALAEKIGVSRQAISKWETGEASPEISKLPLLAKTFGVTADWLLTEDEAAPEETAEQDAESATEASGGRPDAPGGNMTVNAVPDWVDKLPSFLGRLIRRYGWIIGVRIAISGALFTAMGFVAKAMFGSMNSYASQQMNSIFGGGVTAYDNAGNLMDIGDLGLSASDFGLTGSVPFGFSTVSAMPDAFSILCNFIIVVGLVLLIGGAALAWYLKKKGTEV